MRLLTFAARRFGWSTHSRTLDHVPEHDEAREVADAVVVFMHVEERDVGETRSRAITKSAKHIKWIANKRANQVVVLHSFAHLGGASADALSAEQFLSDLANRLQTTGYTVHTTPFGYFCAWDLDVLGDSLAKVYKEF